MKKSLDIRGEKKLAIGGKIARKNFFKMIIHTL